MKVTTVAYSKSTRENHIDVRGKVDGEANTISTGDGGSNMSTQNFVAEKEEVKMIHIASTDAKFEHNGRIYSEDGIMRTLTSREHKDVSKLMEFEPTIRIRKLTPVETERLQGYPDSWTKYGRKTDGTVYEMSNTQRYKQTGNGVSAPVAATILSKLIQEPVDVQSLFTGIGGTELALPKNFNVVGHCEFDKYASDVLRYNYPNIKNWGDVTKFVEQDVPSFDLLTFGFPCQSFSIAGLRQGFEDEKGRGQMIYHCFDILQKHKPKYFMAENVKGLLNHDKGNTFIEILKGLSQIGYDVDFELVNSKHYGLSQNRERVFIFGKLK